MEKNIIIKDGTSESQLMKAIKNFENKVNTTVLVAFVSKDHILLLTEFDNTSVAQWRCSVDTFINGVEIEKMELITTL